MTRATFSHENFGDTARVELMGNEVAIVFVARTDHQARQLAYDIMDALQEGNLHLTLAGEAVATHWDGDEDLPLRKPS